MIINGETIRAANLIHGAVPARFTTVGYNFTVGKIYVPRKSDWSKGQLLDEYEIPPQGVVVVFSEETVTLPTDVCGYAMPKTGLCDEGVLVFNTGLIDPGYSGKVSGTTVNFCKTPYVLRRGDQFLRGVFERVIDANAGMASVNPVPPVPSADELAAYQGRKIAKAQEFSDTFLNIPATAKKIIKDEVSRERNMLLGAIAIISLLFAIIQIAPPAIDYFRTSGLKTTIEQQNKQLEELQKKVKEDAEVASKRAKGLEDELEKLRQAGASRPTP